MRACDGQVEEMQSKALTAVSVLPQANINEQNAGKQILVPLSSSLYVPGEISDIKEVRRSVAAPLCHWWCRALAT